MRHNREGDDTAAASPTTGGRGEPVRRPEPPTQRIPRQGGPELPTEQFRARYRPGDAAPTERFMRPRPPSRSAAAEAPPIPPPRFAARGRSPARAGEAPPVAARPPDALADRGHRGGGPGGRPRRRRTLCTAPRGQPARRGGRMRRQGRGHRLVRRESALPVAARHRALHEHLGGDRGQPGPGRQGDDRRRHRRGRAVAGFQGLEGHDRHAERHADVDGRRHQGHRRRQPPRGRQSRHRRDHRRRGGDASTSRPGASPSRPSRSSPTATSPSRSSTSAARWPRTRCRRRSTD